MPTQPPCAPGGDDPPRDNGGEYDGDQPSYPIAIGLRRDQNTGQFRRRQPGDPLPGLFDEPD